MVIMAVLNRHYHTYIKSKLTIPSFTYCRSLIHDTRSMKGLLSDLPRSSHPLLATAAFDLHRHFLFNVIDDSKPHTPQISDLKVVSHSLLSNLRSQNTIANCSFTPPSLLSPSTGPSHRCFSDPLLSQHCHRLPFLHYMLFGLDCWMRFSGKQKLASQFSWLHPDMPKQKRYKNLLKATTASAASNASQVKFAATANSSRDTSAAAANFSRHKSTAVVNFSRDKSTVAANSSRDKSTTAANFSRDKSEVLNSFRDKSAASNSSRDKSAAVASSSRDKSAASNSSEPLSVAPTIYENPPKPKHKRGRESKHYWTIDAIDEYEDSTRLHLLVKDVHNLPKSLRIVVNFDKQHAAIGEAVGLLAGVCGQLATNCVAFPISFDKWSNISESFFENQWNIFFLVRFHFKFYDPRLSKTEIINNTLEDVAPDQWALFVEYRLKPETQTEETGKEVSRVQMWDITHKKIDGSYVNENAKEIAEKIEAYSSQQAVESTINSPLDALGLVLGKEHPSRVRGLGMGTVPTVAFKNNTTRISQMNLGSLNDDGTSSTWGPNVQEELDTGLNQESEILSPRELGSRSSRASNKEA
ncbi:hypothetical protein Ahy_A07g034960 [Arachis hypogaea]|uniref:Uncharacterized protein n=1 Tax=Arachis hypogaea TaxID=3818 RepID=A0A445CD49_ARAHY|nr:hypothetical protein Ahy_A07g034960 [Arachis hypogaea]